MQKNNKKCKKKYKKTLFCNKSLSSIASWRVLRYKGTGGKTGAQDNPVEGLEDGSRRDFI